MADNTPAEYDSSKVKNIKFGVTNVPGYKYGASATLSQPASTNTSSYKVRSKYSHLAFDHSIARAKRQLAEVEEMRAKEMEAIAHEKATLGRVARAHIVTERQQKRDAAKLTAAEEASKLFSSLLCETKARMEAQHFEEIREKVDKEVTMYKLMYEEGRREELIAEMKKELAPLVVSRLEVAKMSEVKATLAQELKAEVVHNLKVEFEEETRIQLHNEMENGVRAYLHVELQDSVRAELRCEMAGTVEARLRAELEDSVRAQLRVDLIKNVRAHLRTEMEHDVRAQLRMELEEAVRAQLRAEMEGKILAQLQTEMEPITGNDKNEAFASETGHPTTSGHADITINSTGSVDKSGSSVSETGPVTTSETADTTINSTGSVDKSGSSVSETGPVTTSETADTIINSIGPVDNSGFSVNEIKPPGTGESANTVINSIGSVDDSGSSVSEINLPGTSGNSDRAKATGSVDDSGFSVSLDANAAAHCTINGRKRSLSDTDEEVEEQRSAKRHRNETYREDHDVDVQEGGSSEGSRSGSQSDDATVYDTTEEGDYENEEDFKEGQQPDDSSGPNGQPPTFYFPTGIGINGPLSDGDDQSGEENDFSDGFSTEYQSEEEKEFQANGAAQPSISNGNTKDTAIEIEDSDEEDFGEGEPNTYDTDQEDYNELGNESTLVGDASYVYIKKEA